MSPSIPPDEEIYVGDVWWIEAEILNSKTKAPGNPTTATGRVYSPKMWQEREEGLAPVPISVTFKMQTLGHWELTAPVALSEAGIWRCEVDTDAPFEAVQPGLITVQPLSEL